MNSNIPSIPNYHITQEGVLYRFKKGSWVPVKYSIRNGRKCYFLQGPTRGFRLNAHRLVALAWIPNPNNYPCVCHKDNNKLNDHVDNLYWGTHKMNAQQALRDGLLKFPQDRLTPRIARRIIRLHLLGWSLRRISKRIKVYSPMGVQGNIKRLLKNK